MTTTADGKTVLNVKDAGLYKIIQSNQARAGTLELRVLDPGLKAFTFTFG